MLRISSKSQEDKLFETEEVDECCGAYCSEAGCCPYIYNDEQEVDPEKKLRKNHNPLENDLELE